MNSVGLHDEKNRRVLAVDDDESILTHYRQILAPSVQATAAGSERLTAVLEEGLGKSAEVGEARQPYQLDCFSQGAEAIAAVEQALAAQQPYTVALVDMRMLPGIDGLETARRIRALDSEIFIIFVTAYSDYTIDELSNDISGAILWFRKPFHSEEIYQVVRNCCTSWNHARELELLRRDLADRVEIQTERLQIKMRSVMALQKNAMKRELRMGDMKRELRSLKAYQDLRLLLKEDLSPRAQDSQRSPVELLLVDDSATVRAINKSKLEAVGFHVTVSESVDEAFQIARQSQFEVALIDFYMPGGNGDKLISLLRDDPHTMYILPLLFTNAGDEMMAVEAGAVYWMSKDQSNFLNKMELVRDYVQDNRAFQPPQALPGPLSDNRRVLVVDDESANLRVIHNILVPAAVSQIEEQLEEIGVELSSAVTAKQTVDEPFELTEVDQGEAAIAAVREAQFEEAPFAIALIDMRMPPGIDGLETARQIRQISPQIDIVIMTAFSDYSLQQIRAVLGDNFSFLMKPFNNDVLLQRVVEGCEKWATVNEVNASHHALLNLAGDMDEENTRRREAEQELEAASEELRQSARLLQQEKGYMEEIFFSMQEPLLVMDHSATVLECNTALLKLAGSSRASVIGRSVNTLFGETDPQLDAEFIQQNLQLFQRRMQLIHDIDHHTFHKFLRGRADPLLVVSLESEHGVEYPLFLLSGRLESQLGYPPESLIGRSVLDLLSAAEGEQLQAYLQGMGRGSVKIEAENFHWLGSERVESVQLCMFYVRCCGAPRVVIQLLTEHTTEQELLLKAPFGEILQGANDDIFSEALQAVIQQDLDVVASRRELLCGYIERTTLPMMLVNRQMEISILNAAAGELAGYGEGALEGATIEQLLPESMRVAHHKLAEAFFQQPETRSMGRDRMLPILRGDGTERMIEIALFPLEVESQSQVVVALYDHADRESLDLFKTMHPEIKLTEQEGLQAERMLRSAEGELIPVSVSGTLLHNVDGGINGTVLMLHDLRERKRAEQREQYAAFQSGLAEMSANILHNVGNTIQGMDSAVSDLEKVEGDLSRVGALFLKFAEQLKRAKAEGVEQYEEMQAKMVEAGRRVPQVIDRMGELWVPSLHAVQTGISHIKEVIRMQQHGGEVNVHIVRFSLPQLFDDLHLLMESGIRREGIELSEKIDRSVPEVKLPRNQLLQAMINVIKNSVESIEERTVLGGLQEGEGRIGLAAVVEENQLKLVVEDNGNGIDPAITDNLLRFGFTTKAGGSGFGLHATGNFVVSCGGTIKLESEGVGEGATVTMLLPLEERVDV